MADSTQNNLDAVRDKIAAVLVHRPQCYITHPAELFFLKELTLEELHAFAEQHGWRSVRRIGGRQIEFYNDVAVQSEQADRRTA